MGQIPKPIETRCCNAKRDRIGSEPSPANSLGPPGTCICSHNFAAEICPVQAELRFSVRLCATLQLCAGVGVDFAVQTNFFKLRSRPFHDFPPSFGVCVLVPTFCLQNVITNPKSSNRPHKSTDRPHTTAIQDTRPYGVEQCAFSNCLYRLPARSEWGFSDESSRSLRTSPIPVNKI